MVLLANLLWSRYGRAFRAVRDDEIAASLAGIHVARTKVTAFTISAGCAGLGGALLALSTGVVNTGEFPLTLSIQLLAAMVLGGTGTLIGMVWGGILLVYLPHWSTSLSSDFNLGSGANAYLATHHLRRRADRGDAGGARRDPGRAALGVGAPAAPSGGRSTARRRRFPLRQATERARSKRNQ